MNDYLFDKDGSDPEIESLERLLRPMALKGHPPAKQAPPRRPLASSLVMAAAAALFVVGAIRILQAPPAGPSYQVESAHRRYTAAVGLEIAGVGTQRTIDLGSGLGKVIAEPDARLRVVRISDELHKLRLDYGTVHASISAAARPGLFQIETPSTTCIDLGCQYTLSVDALGGAVVNVLTGRVAFEDGGREVFIPAGAGCRAVAGRGSGTPTQDDADEVLKAAVRKFDEGAPDRRAGFAREIAALVSRHSDCLVLWHFLQDPDDAVLEIGVDALEKTVSMPLGTTRDAAMKRDPEARKAWKEHIFPDYWK